jgi:hypothetical protein
MFQIVAVLFLVLKFALGFDNGTWVLSPDPSGNLYWIDTRASKPAPLFNVETDVQFLLYTRNNKNTPQILSTGPSTDLSLLRSKPIKFLIHGWQNDRNDQFNQLIKNAFLEEGDVNVVFVDWSEGAKHIIYEWSRVLVEPIGLQVAKFIAYLFDKKYVESLEQICIVGHSLGAHAAGFTGKHLYLLTKQKVPGISLQIRINFRGKLLRNQSESSMEKEQ